MNKSIVLASLLPVFAAASFAQAPADPVHKAPTAASASAAKHHHKKHHRAVHPHKHAPAASAVLAPTPSASK